MLSWFHLDRLMFNLEFLTKTGNAVNVPVHNVRIINISNLTLKEFITFCFIVQKCQV